MVAPDLIDTAANTADHWYRQGAEALERGALEQAAGALWQCLVLDAGHASALHLLGKVRLQQGQQEAALALQLGSWRQDPALGWNAFAAAELLGREGRWGEAAAAFRAAFDVLPAEAWIGALQREAEGLGVFRGERLAAGLSEAAYRIWCRGVEPSPPRPPSPPGPPPGRTTHLAPRPFPHPRGPARLPASLPLPPPRCRAAGVDC